MILDHCQENRARKEHRTLLVTLYPVASAAVLMLT